MESKYTVSNIAATPAGIPISKYYPNLSSDNVIFNGEIELNYDLGPYKKGTKVTGETFTDLFNAMLSAFSNSGSGSGTGGASSAEIEELKETIAKQQETIDSLKKLVEESGGSVTWPDISNVDGGTSDDAGENGGEDDVSIPNA